MKDKINFPHPPHIITNNLTETEYETNEIWTSPQWENRIIDTCPNDYLTENKELTFLCSFVEKYFQNFCLNSEYKSKTNHLKELFKRYLEKDLQTYQPSFWVQIEKYIK